MKQPAKPQRKKPAAPALDWRELAGGPALRGLSEVLTGPVGERPTVVEPTGLGSAGAVSREAPDPPAPAVAVDPTEGETPSAGEKLAPVDSLAAGSSTLGTATQKVLPRPTIPTSAVSPAAPRTSTAPRPPTAGVTPPPRPALWVDSHGRTYEAKRVFPIADALASLALGEERVYRLIRDAAAEGGPGFRLLSMGYDRMARLAGLNEKSIRDLIPKLLAKQVIEVAGAENSASRTGKTYRIYDPSEILRRQRALDLTHGVKNGRAVEFVWLLQDSAVSQRDHLTATEGEPPPVGEPMIGTPDVALIHDALSSYGTASLAAAEALSMGVLRVEPTAATAEIIHFLHEKGRALASTGVASPVAYLVVSVPPCFHGPAFQAFRRRQRETQAARQRETAEIRRELDRQRAILDNPSSSAAEKHWARLALGIDGPADPS